MPNFEKILTQLLCNLGDEIKNLANVSGQKSNREIVATVRTIQFDSITQGQVILDKNPSRVGFTTVNMSTGDVYLLFGQDNISASHFSRKIPAQAMDDYIPVNNPYREEVRIYVKDSSGFCTITEYSYND